MPTVIAIGRWQVEVDLDSTAALYATLPVGSGCDCEDCKNFDLVVADSIPAELTIIASNLGIDLRKPAEIAHFGEDPPGRFIVAPWYHAAGRVLEGSSAWVESGPDLRSANFEKFPSGVEIGVHEDVQLVPEVFKGRSLIQLEALFRVPWVLNPGEQANEV